MVYIGEKQITGLSGTSSRFQMVLSMIDDGTDWMKWAIADKIFSSVSVANEDQLLISVQQGLHMEDDIRFNTFRANIRKILTLSSADIEQLAAINKTANDNELNLRSLLQRNGMMNYSDIGSEVDISGRFRDTRPDLFKALTFSDQLALAQFVRQQTMVSDDDIKNQSYSFAISKANTVTDFINLSLFFQTASQAMLSDNLVLLMKENEVQAIYKQLLAESAGYLYTPNAGRGRGERALREKIPELVRANKFIGYLTINSCISNLSQNLSVSSSTTQQTLKMQIENYLTSVKNIVAFSPASSYLLSQDGNTAILRFDKDKSVVLIGVDAAGNVFIHPDTKI